MKELIAACEPIYAKEVIELRRWFHAHPETSDNEIGTSRKVAEELQRMGISYKRIGKGQGIVATVKGASEGKTFLLRADMDALAVEELNTCEYRSVNPGIMHACGHDCHIAMALTAAHILADHADRICGTVKIAFQPSEENGKGALDLVEHGVMDGVSGCFGIHVWSDIPAGKVSVPPGPRMAGCGRFRIRINGVGTHGAQPHQGIDAGLVMAAMVQNLQSVVSRNTNPLHCAVLSIGTQRAGSAWNVVPETAELAGTTRFFDSQVRDRIGQDIERIALATAQTFGATAQVDYDTIVSAVVNNEMVSVLASEVAESVLGPEWNSDYAPTMVGEDFSQFIERAPGAMALLGVRNEALGACWPQHSGHYAVDESVLIKGALLHALTAMEFLRRQ